jgi:DNA-binding transcriptional LysR family regulator
MDDLNDILIFTKVVEKGSFTAAAQSLMLPKSTVSRALSRLEARLSTRLLQRSTRRINLTEIGRRYYDRCRQIMQELEAANGIVESYRAQPSGLLRITAPYVLGQAFLGEIVAEFLATYPRLLTLCLFLRQKFIQFLCRNNHSITKFFVLRVLSDQKHQSANPQHLQN